jgi:hypothetical protein
VRELTEKYTVTVSVTTSWFVTLKEYFQMWVLYLGPRKIFVPKTKEVAGGCRKYHDEERHYSSCSAISIRMLRSRWLSNVCGGTCGVEEKHL